MHLTILMTSDCFHIISARIVLITASSEDLVESFPSEINYSLDYHDIFQTR